jgi:hypothetical protein
MPLPVPEQPINVPAPIAPTDVRVQPFVIRDQQDWAVTHERRYQSEALYRYGEYAMFLLMWDLEDYKAGLVDRCSRCWGRFGRVAEAYKQASQSMCPDCFGTTFEGGFRARVVRPTVWNDSTDDIQPGQRGEVLSSDTQVQTTSDIQIHPDDFVFRADGSRWQARDPSGQTARTGFGPDAKDRVIANVPFRVTKLSSTDTGFMDGLFPKDLQIPWLSRTARMPVDFSSIEIIRGYLG